MRPFTNSPKRRSTDDKTTPEVAEWGIKPYLIVGALVTLLLVGAFFLRGWSAGDATAGDQDSTQAAPEEPVVAEPTRIAGPEAMESCTISLSATEGAEGRPDRAVIECGTQEPLEVGGDFRDEVGNFYAPAEVGGLEQIIVVNGEARAWLQIPEGGTCLIAYTPGEEDVACEPTAHHTDVEERESGTPLTPDMLAERGA